MGSITHMTTVMHGLTIGCKAWFPYDHNNRSRMIVAIVVIIETGWFPNDHSDRKEK